MIELYVAAVQKAGVKPRNFQETKITTTKFFLK
jgi:hypothetical protein